MFACAIAAVVALASSLLLLWRGRSGRGMPGCAAGSDCTDVTASRWARIGSVPVALPGAAIYAAIIVCALLEARGALVSLCTLAAGAAIWFLVIQAFVLRRICVYCATAHLAAIAAALFSLHRSEDWRFALAGGGAVVVLIALQLLIPQRAYRVLVASKAISKPAHVANTQISSPPKTTRMAPPISVLKGELSLEWDLFPLLGEAGAAHVIVNLMDYTCQQCRSLHPLLSGAIAHYETDLAVVVIPVPLESGCNRFVNVFDPRHVNACEYSRLALAIWRTRRRRGFRAFHEWLMTGVSAAQT